VNRHSGTTPNVGYTSRSSSFPHSSTANSTGRRSQLPAVERVARPTNGARTHRRSRRICGAGRAGCRRRSGVARNCSASSISRERRRRAERLESARRQPPHATEPAPLTTHSAKAGHAVSPPTSPRASPRHPRRRRGRSRGTRQVVALAVGSPKTPTTCASSVERATGIEPAWPAWKAGALPLSYARARRTTANNLLESTDAAGRSVVASAPALGAGDREFESPRPDERPVRPQ
jgi:hypothetical protein